MFNEVINILEFQVIEELQLDNGNKTVILGFHLISKK